MAWRSTLCILAAFAAASPVVEPGRQQQPLALAGGQAGASDLIAELKEAEVIPTVFDTFTPLLTLAIFWENATAEVGNTVDPSELQKAPDVQFLNVAPNLAVGSKRSKSVQLTLALTDPDAPSRDNPEWSEICHWIATGVKLTHPDDEEVQRSVGAFSKGVTEIMPYKPPGPPPKTGKHRYVFVALAPKNGTTEKLSLSTPGDRQHWGYEKKEQGLRTWAKENGLEVVGANFVYAQNEKQ